MSRKRWNFMLAAILAAIAFHPEITLAQVRAFYGDVEAVSNATVISGGLASLASNDTAWVFVEQSHVQLAADLDVDITTAGTYGTPLSTGVIAAGEWVTSYLLHMERATPLTTAHYTGRVVFGGEILGIIVTDANLNASDAIVGLSVTYPSSYRGLELSGPDSVTWDGNQSVRIDCKASVYPDQIRVIVRGLGDGMTFSMDAQGPSRYGADAWGDTMSEDDILTPGDGGSPGPNPPVLSPASSPGVVLDASDLGIGSAGTDDAREVDAFSFGNDFGTRVRFSVDEFAKGVSGSASPDVYSEGASGSQEASADVFRYEGPLVWSPGAGSFGNALLLDGDGSSHRGYGLVEPNAPTFSSLPDPGDNLDGLDIGTTSTDVASRIFYSLDASFTDPAESGAPNYGTADANGFSAADVITAYPGVAPSVYASAAALGLQSGQLGEEIDDVDALMIWDDGDGEYQSSADRIFFSLRRGSWTVENGVLDGRLGIPITESDVLLPGSPPRIAIPGEAMGLCTRRSCTPADSTWDDLDALDRIPDVEAPVANPDQGNVNPGGTVLIRPLENDAALRGQLDPTSILILDQPEHGTVTVNIADIVYGHHGGIGATDEFSYIVFDSTGRPSEPATVTIVVLGSTSAPAGVASRPASLAFAGPNPFRAGTAFTVASSSAGRVQLDIYAVSGRRVRRLLDHQMSGAWRRVIEWDGRDEAGRQVAAGVYTARLATPDGVSNLRAVRLR